MAMTCKRCVDRLSGYVDGVLTARDFAGVTAHLASCASCRRNLEEIQAVKILLGGSDTPEVRSEFWAEALSALDRAAERRRRTTRVVRGLRLAGVAIAAAALGFAQMQIARETVPVEKPGPVEAPTFDPAALVSLHAVVRATRPLADAGKVRFAISEGNARDYANDARLDTQ